MNTWIRDFWASLMDSQARSMSSNCMRASPQMIGPFTFWATDLTASNSDSELMGKPASMMSTPSAASWWAISTFSLPVRLMSGDCSPSRSVVSKIRT